jgi:hypothetical protein
MTDLSVFDCPLTPAEVALLQECRSLGTTRTQVLARATGKTPHTVNTYFKFIKAKLEVPDRETALLTAEIRGWLERSSEVRPGRPRKNKKSNF